MSIVRINPPRVAQEIAAAFAPYGVATVHEAQGRKGLLHSTMRPVWRRARAVGTAVTTGALAFVAVHAKQIAERLTMSRGGGMLALRGLELAAAVAVLVLGLGLLTGTLAGAA